MSTMLMAIFNTRRQALKGVIPLKDLHRVGDIKLYTIAVIGKDASGTISLKQAAEREWEHTVHGLLIGILVGTLGGPIGLAIGGSIGALAGLTLDLKGRGQRRFPGEGFAISGAREGSSISGT